MVISHKHRYLFVELPHTGSTAISHELRDLYDGQSILGKHSPYHEFVRQASEDEKRYFVFSGIRNPLDVAVTKYFKYKTDHNRRYTSARKIAANRGLGNSLDRKIYAYVRRTDADFSRFFLAVYHFPYNSWASLSHKEFDFIVRFENLGTDFERALRAMGLEPKRPLPRTNRTAEKRMRFDEYYSSAAIERAKWVFGPYMHEWGYTFPAEWGAVHLNRLNRLGYDASTALMQFYWRRLKSRLWRKDRRYLPAGVRQGA